MKGVYSSRECLPTSISTRPNDMIKIQGLSKSFGDVRAVQATDLNVAAGEIMGLVGPDGAGKTTLIRMICGVSDADDGSIEIYGYPIARLDEIRDQFGYMPQRFSLYMDLTVMENIEFFASLYAVKKETIKERAATMLERMGIAGFNNRLAGNLSGGMKQKLALTCSLINHPRLLVLDEPTYGVDPESRQEFWKILYELNREGLTILVSTPYMDEAELCSRVAVMNDGKIIAVGKPADLRSGLTNSLLEIRVGTKDPLAFTECPGLISSTFYGDKFHLEVDDVGEASLAVQEYIEARGWKTVSLREISPSMEDVFVQIAGKQVR